MSSSDKSDRAWRRWSLLGCSVSTTGSLGAAFLQGAACLQMLRSGWMHSWNLPDPTNPEGSGAGSEAYKRTWSSMLKCRTLDPPLETLIQPLWGGADTGPRPTWQALLRALALLPAKRGKAAPLHPGTSSSDFFGPSQSKFSALVFFITPCYATWFVQARGNQEKPTGVIFWVTPLPTVAPHSWGG